MADTETSNSPTMWEELTSPLNLVLIAVIVYLIYKIIKSNFESEANVPPPPPPLPKLKKDLTVAELGKYDGTQPDGRVLLAVNGVIFDVTRGKRFYGPGGPYSAFAGKDATRGLATGQVAASDIEYDDCSDLGPDEVASAKEWEEQFRVDGCKYGMRRKMNIKEGERPREVEEIRRKADPGFLRQSEGYNRERRYDEYEFTEKYDIVGRLLKPGETPNKYSDDESEDKKSQ